MILYKTDYLAHHGILGMKWGVRRYQNKDGSLTAEGQRRQALDKKSEELSNKAQKLRDKDPAQKKLDEMFDDWKKKHPNADDDDYGDYIVDHPALEKKYNDLLSKTYSSKYQKKAYDLETDSNRVKSTYVKNNTSGVALASSFMAAPVTMLITNKALKAFGVSGKKRAIAVLGVGAGSVGTLTVSSYIHSRKEHEEAAKKYGLDKNTIREKRK